jgi:hypothetical protein
MRLAGRVVRMVKDGMNTSIESENRKTETLETPDVNGGIMPEGMIRKWGVNL